MTTLERLNTVLCSPAGRPMSKICFSVPAWKASRRRSSRSAPSSRKMCIRDSLWDEQYAGNILMFNNSRDAYEMCIRDSPWTPRYPIL